MYFVSDYATGAIDLTVIGGVTPYSYAWSNSATTEDISNLTDGTYQVVVTDNHGCVDSIATTITEPADSMTITFTKVDILCHGESTGSIDLTVTGGNAPYTFAWNSGQTTEDLTNVPAGIYTVDVTDNNGCVQSITVELIEPNAALASSHTHVDILCYGDSTGSIDLSVTDGSPGYTYQWNNGPTTEDQSNIPAGTYIVTITDDHNCTLQDTVVLSQPDSLELSLTQTNILCYDASTGSIDLTVAGGITPYSYTWSNSATTEDISNLPAGLYQVIVTDNHGCVDSIETTVTQPTDSMTITFTTVDILCFGDSTGSIDVSISGGNAPYTFSWDSGQTTEDIANLPSGTYTITVTDNNNCSQDMEITVTQPAMPLTLSETHQNALCMGGIQGSIDVTVIGGTPGYSYQWNNSATTQDISNLNAGYYHVTVTDTNGCMDTISATITDPDAVTLTETHTHVSCFGGSDGAIDLTISGGTPGYTQQWNTTATTEDISGLSEGNYFVDVYDANNCGAFLSVLITQPDAPLALTDSITHVLCYSYTTGAIDVEITGGTPGYSYLWNTGDTTQDIQNQPAGIYTLTVTDTNGCILNYTDTITQPTELVMTETHVDVLCFGDSTGSIDISTTGGVTPYTYQWDHGPTTEDLANIPAGTYTVVATDSNACLDTLTINIIEPLGPLTLTDTAGHVSCFNGDNGFIDLTVTGGSAPYSYDWNNTTTTEDINTLTAGTYTVIVTDDHGCIDSLSRTITQPDSLELSLTQTNILCFDDSTGAIDLTVIGGVTPYNYAWNNGETTQDISNLPDGSYQVVVTDDNGCVDSIATMVTQPADSMTITFTKVDILCHGDSTGSIDLNVTGGTAPYSYAWSSGQTTQDISNLPAGTYTVDVTDDNGCVQSITIQLIEPIAPLALTDTYVDILCHGDATGSIDLTVTGGTPGYSYDWSNTATTEDINGLVAGTYTVIVTDDHGCIDSLTRTLSEPAAPVSLNISMTPVICFGDSTGTVSVVASGGTPGYTYLWNTGDTLANVNNLPIGTYSVTVTDSNGCIDTASIVVTQPPLLEGQISHVDVLCHGDATGSVTTIITGGVPPYDYVWNTTATTDALLNVPAGPYEVVVTDQNNCSITLNDTILEPAAPLNITFSVFNNLCFGDSSANIDATVSGGTAPYSYSWDSGQLTEDINTLTAGTYELTVTDDNNCVLVADTSVIQPDLITTQNVDITHVSCFALSDGEIDFTPTGGTTPYSFQWNDPANSTTEDVNNLPAGTYTVAVTDTNNCVQTFDFTVTQPDTLEATYSFVEPLCYGYSDGSLTAVPTGGTTPYSYSWDNGPTTALNDNIPAGDYVATITDANGCVFVLDAELGQPDQFDVTFDVDQNEGCDPFEVNFTNTSEEQFHCEWDFGNGDVATGCTPNYTYVDAGTYTVTLTVTTALGCQKFSHIYGLHSGE